MRSPRADRFTHSKANEVVHAQRCGKGKRAAAVLGDGVNVERHAHVNHGVKIGEFPRSGLPLGSNVFANAGFRRL